MKKIKLEIRNVEADGNTIRFINVRKGEEDEQSIVIESRRVVNNK